MQRLIDALDRRMRPLHLYFRDDDAGWAAERLDALLDMFARLDCPIDLAVIPAVLTEAEAGRLAARRARQPGVAFHQHGFAHLNYEPEGARKCEFGSSRPVDRQCADIAMGRERLLGLLGEVEPMFTPPWNRCLPETVVRLPGLGFAVYSDDAAAVPQPGGPLHVPIHLDWERARRSDQQLAALQTLFARDEEHLGLMLHHAVMTRSAIDEFAAVLAAVRNHPNLRPVAMRTVMENCHV